MPDQMPTYNLKAVIHETGLNAETIRAWERRYGLPKPQRSQGGHRMYSLHDIQLLKWLVGRQEEGLSISRAVQLWRSLAASGQDPLAGRAAAQAYPQGGASLNELRQAWVMACLDYNEPAAERALAQAFAITAPEIACIEILQKGLSEIGTRWYQGEASVQQEHFASALAMRRLHALVSATPAPSRPARLLAACPPGEEHQFPLLLATYLLRRHGWDVVYLGANVPLDRLEATLKATSPALVISLAETLPAAAALADLSASLHQQGARLGYGGLIFNVLPDLQARISGSYLGEQIASIPTEVERVLRQPLTPAVEPLDASCQKVLESYLENQSLIESNVTYEFAGHRELLTYLGQANSSMAHHLEAALSLGDVSLLSDSLEWVQGLVENAGLPPKLVHKYLAAYRFAADKCMGSMAASITAWFDHFLDEASAGAG